MAGTWTEIGDGIAVVRYPYLSQNIGLILGHDEAAVIDTRTTLSQAREVARDVERHTRLPVRIVFNTHGHGDHSFGNSVFRPAVIWGQAGCESFMRRTYAIQVAQIGELEPVIVGELEEGDLVPPDRTVETSGTVSVGGRSVELRHFGRAHTDHDLVLFVPDAGVAFTGDLIRPGGQPYFGDGFPLDWAGTLRGFMGLPWERLSSGHGDAVDRAYVLADIARHDALAGLARLAHANGEPWDSIVGGAPFPSDTARVAIQRAYAQLDGSA